jgi:hypothetical protein
MLLTKGALAAALLFSQGQARGIRRQESAPVDGEYTTIYTSLTSVNTVTSCGPEVTNCPGSSATGSVSPPFPTGNGTAPFPPANGTTPVGSPTSTFYVTVTAPGGETEVIESTLPAGGNPTEGREEDLPQY